MGVTSRSRMRASLSRETAQAGLPPVMRTRQEPSSQSRIFHISPHPQS